MPARTIARKIEELPPLQEGHIRLVHCTSHENAESVAKTGLDYSKHGIASATTIGFAPAPRTHEEYFPHDPRFSHEGISAVVMDLPFAEHRKHESMTSAPGRLPAKFVVGILARMRK